MWRMARTDGGYFRLLFPLELAAPLPGRGLAIQRCFRALYACQIRKTLVGVLTWTNRQSVGAAWRWRGGLRPCSAPGLSNKGPLKANSTPLTADYRHQCAWVAKAPCSFASRRLHRPARGSG